MLDGAVTILDAVQGVQAQSETVWKQANRYNVPRVAYLNKMDRFLFLMSFENDCDRDGANVERTLKMMKDKLGANPIPIQLSLGYSGLKEKNFN